MQSRHGPMLAHRNRWRDWIKAEVSVGNLLILFGLLGSIAAGFFQAGMIRASLESSIQGEHDLRVSEMSSIELRLTGMQEDIREVRSLLQSRNR